CRGRAIPRLPPRRVPDADGPGRTDRHRLRRRRRAGDLLPRCGGPGGGEARGAARAEHHRLPRGPCPGSAMIAIALALVAAAAADPQAATEPPAGPPLSGPALDARTEEAA